MDNYFNASSGAAALNFLGGIGTSLVNFGFNSYLNDVNWLKRQALYVQQHRDAINDWNMVNEYNTPAAERARKEAAGYNALDEMSISPAQPINQNDPSGQTPIPASFSNPVADAIQGALAANQIELQKSQIDVNEAQKNKIQSETSINQLNSQFLQDTMQTRQRALELSNTKDEEIIKTAQQNRKNMEQEFEKLVNETHNELEKGLLMQAQRHYYDAQSTDILACIPYKQDLMKAQTLAQKAAASASYWSAMYQKGLISSGYIDMMIEKAEAEIRQSDSAAAAAAARKALDGWKLSVQSGHAFDYIINDPNANYLERNLAGFFNGVFNVANMITTSVGNVFPKL